MQHWQSSPHQHGFVTGGLGSAKDFTPTVALLLVDEMFDVLPEPGREYEVEVPAVEGISVKLILLVERYSLLCARARSSQGLKTLCCSAVVRQFACVIEAKCLPTDGKNCRSMALIVL